MSQTEINHQLKLAFAGKRVFITGHTGFKGSWMWSWLWHLGAELKGYSLAPIGANALFTAISGENMGQSIEADIRDRLRIEKELLDFQPDFVFHMAAQPLVRRSYEIPAETFEVNVVGTANLLEALKKQGKPCATVVVTTDKVYKNREWQFPYRENDELGGHDPYSASKAAAEIVTDSMRNSFFPNEKITQHGQSIASARSGNVIGGGDWSEDRIMPDIVRSLYTGRPVIVRNPASIRPWQHVLEPVGGYLLLAKKMAERPTAFNEGWNFGPYPADELTVGQLVETAIAVWGSGKMEAPEQKNQPHEAGLLKLDISKASARLGWSPIYDSRTAIEKTIFWYKNWLVEKGSATNYIIQQIEGFCKRV